MPPEKSNMDLVVLDLEWNGAFSRKLGRYLNEIIEFGAVRTDEHLNVLDTFSEFVRPQVGKKISGKVSTLTSITSEQLENGSLYQQILSRFGKWSRGAAVLTWGTSDVLTLIENCRYYCGSDRIPFLHRYADLQAYCEQSLRQDGSQQLGLSSAAGLLGVDESGCGHHRALDDSILELECLRRIYSPESFAPFLQDAEDREFYRRMEFRTVAVCDLKSPLIRAGDLAFRCEKCGRRARRTGDWELRSKSFRAPFLCGGCGNRFVGRVQFKLKYEGLVVRKKIFPQDVPEHSPVCRAAETGAE